MTALPTQALLEQAFIRACALDVGTLKPGNVSADAPGHRMTAAQFIASAAVAAPALCRSGAPVGQRIRAAVEATIRVAGCNTNLGIVLLCAPIAAAAEALASGARAGAAASSGAGDAGDAGGTGGARDAGGAGGAGGAGDVDQSLRHRLREVTHSLTVADADDAFRAIALASPAGLGSIEQHDVHAAATIDLRAAMSLAADRDMVAQQYANDFADVFDTGIAAWRDECGRHAERRGQSSSLAMQRVYLEFLARFPDSHIARKHGAAAARAVSREAQARLRRRGADVSAAQVELAAWDAQLKSAGINPGTSADLAVATAFLVEMVLHPSTMPTAGRVGVMLDSDGADNHPGQRRPLHCVINVRGAH